MKEVRVKTHLIITDIHEEYYIDWCGSIVDAKPFFKNNMPVFIIISNESRIELNTTNIKEIEECAKKITKPHGRQAITTDVARIYIKEENGNQKLLGKVFHNHVKQYAPMYDKVGWI